MKSSLYCLLMFSLVATPVAHGQEMKNKVCSQDRCVYYPTTLGNPTGNSNKQLPPTNKIQDKVVEPKLSAPTSIVYKYRDNSGKWVYADHLPKAKHLVYYIVDEE